MQKRKQINDEERIPLSGMNFAKRIDDLMLQEEQQERELQKKLKERNDGSIKGLLLSGDYVRKISGGKQIGGVFILSQNYNENYIEWDIIDEDLGRFSPGCLISVSENNEYSDLCEELEEEIENIVTLCRRKLKKKDILFFIHDLNSSEGLVFTDKSLFVLNDDKLDYIIDYEEMEEIDFDEEELTITVTDGESVTIDCWDDKRAKGVFNLLMDIKEFEE